MCCTFQQLNKILQIFENDNSGTAIKISGGQNDDFRPLTYSIPLGGGAWGAGTICDNSGTLQVLMPTSDKNVIPLAECHRFSKFESIIFNAIVTAKSASPDHG